MALRITRQVAQFVFRKNWKMDNTTGMNGASVGLSEQQHFGIFVIYLKDKIS